jgi:tripartite ATP-independent transporter DctP family solute receptor
MASVPWPGVVRLPLLTLVFCAVASVTAQTREFRVADTQAEDYPTVQALKLAGRLLAARSGGRHSFRVFHSHQLGEEKETIEQTRIGAIDLNRTNVAPLGSIVPTANVLALPFLFRSVAHLHKVLDGPIGDEVLNSFRPYGFVGLAFYDSGARSLYNSVRPVRTIADMKDLRIRVQQSELMVSMIKALGARPIELPYGQVTTGLTTKLIDGAENNWPSFVTTGHYKHARHYTLTEHTMSPEVLIMSVAAWESLVPDDRELVRSVVRQSSRYMRQQWQALEHQSRKKAEADGVLIVADFDRRPFEDAMTDVHAKTAQDPVLAALIARIRKIE